jgi:hypothetical protein
VIGIVASIASVVTLLSILIAVYFFLQHRQRGRTHRATQQKGIEGFPGFTERGVSPSLGPQSAQSSGNTINIINKTMPYPMEKYTSAPASPDFVQSTSNNYVPGRYQQMQSVDAATADLDRILRASVLTPNGDSKAWSSTLSPSTPHSRGVQSSEPSFGTREQPKATIPISPLSFTSNFGDSIIPVGYVRTGITEAESGAGAGRDRAAARRSSTTVTIPGQGKSW